jgi:DNA polymerase III subunit gamma/tau
VAATPSGPIDRDALALAFGDVVMPALKGMAKAIYSGGRFVAVTDQGAVFALDNAPTRDRAEKYRTDVEAALGAHLGSPVHLVLIDAKDADRHQGAGGSAPAAAGASAPDPAAAADTTAADDSTASDDTASDDTASDDTATDDDAAMIDVTELTDATDVATSGIDKLTKAFPGSVLVDGGEGTP